ncbi:MAG: BlaI/MecI/CopY family transcriptional regulator [Verrucomicrobiota bacterium]|jgi:predicted transcriptional regulator
MPKPEIELTAAEWRIIKAVWEIEPCAAPDIQEKLFHQTRWTYSTVRTLMDRMVAKGLLSTEKIRNLSLFRSAVTPAQARRGELAYALKHAFDGALTPMLQCLLETNKLSQSELTELEDLIKAKKRAGKKQIATKESTCANRTEPPGRATLQRSRAAPDLLH